MKLNRATDVKAISAQCMLSGDVHARVEQLRQNPAVKASVINAVYIDLSKALHAKATSSPLFTSLACHCSMAQLAKRLAGTQACAEWRLLPELLAPEQGEHTYHQYTLAAENGLLPPEALHPLWPCLQLQSQGQAATVALAQLLPAGWLLLDCLPAAHLLQGTRLPASTQVVLARVVLSDTAPAGSSLANVQALLAQSRFKAVATFAERNSALGKALFVRDPKGLQDNIYQAQAKAQALEADKAQLTDAKDKALAQVQQLAQEKAQAQQRCDELGKALEADKAQLTEAKDMALAQVQQLAQENAQAQQRCDELVKAKKAEIDANQTQEDTANIEQLHKELADTKQNLTNKLNDLQTKHNTLQKQNQQHERDKQEHSAQLELLKDELTKAEAQIGLIKDIFFQTNPFQLPKGQ